MFPKPIVPSSNGDARPVFITGVPRCGSSWVGELLSAHRGVRYVYEPLNLDWVPMLRGQLSHFQYLNENSEASPIVQKVAENSFRGLQSGKQLIRAAYRGYWRAATHSASRAVVKDPTACLMTEWIAHNFNARVLIVMRHPCGFASSLDKLDWQVRVDFLLRQKDLMRDYLSGYEDVMSHAKRDKWLNRGAFWAAVHKVLMEQRDNHPDWNCYKYEDLCSDHYGQFSELSQKLGLEADGSTQSKIRWENTRADMDPGSTRRISSTMPNIWQQRMSKGEVDAVMGIVGEFGISDYAM